MNWVPIVSIVPDGVEECACIAVSHPSRLYITRGGIITHNTTVERAAGNGTFTSQGLTFEDASPIDQTQADDLRAYTESLQKDARRKGLPPPVITGRSVRELGGISGAAGPTVARFANALRSVFGKRVVFVRAIQGVVPSGGSIPSRANAIFVNTEGNLPLMYLAGHEFGHTLEFQNKELYDALSKVVLAEAGDWSDYRQMLESWGYEPERFESEFVNDFIGGQWLEPQFWQQLESSEPGLFTKMAQAAIDFIDSILAKIAGFSRDTQRYFSDVRKARLALVNTMREFSRSGQFPERTDVAMGKDSDFVRSSRDDSIDAMRLTSMRMSEAVGEMQTVLNEHNATANERTIDGNPIEAAGYVMRRDDDMAMLANLFLDGFAEQQSRSGKSIDETKAELAKLVEGGARPDGEAPISADIQAVLLRTLRLERGAEFGFDPAELDALYQKKASQAGYALRQGRLILDPLDKVVEDANTKTGVAMTTTFGPVDGAQGGAVGTPAALNGELQGELLKENEGALAESLREMREKVRDLRKELKQAQELAAEEKARADQEREVGIAIGHEEGLAQGRAEQPPAPDPQLDRFELWLMGEKHAPGLEGLDSIETVARRFIRSQSWDAGQFRNAVAQLFPDLNTDILDDAVERLDEMFQNKAEAAQRRAISAFMDRLKERGQARGKGQWQDSKFATFFGHLQKAVQFGVLNSQTFANAFAHAWGLHGLTPANVAQMRALHQQINAVNAQGKPVYYGMVRETMERRFVEALNALLPGQALDNFLFNSYQAGVLSSLSSMLNQFSAVGRMVFGLDAVAKATRMGTPMAAISDWWSAVSGLVRDLPFMLTAIRNESLGHLPSMLASGHVPTEQSTQRLGPGERVRLGQRTMGKAFSAVAKFKEQWTWRGIRAAEGLTGLVDADSHFVEVLSGHYRNTGMSPADARAQALRDIYDPSPSELSQARTLAAQEQQQGDIGKGKHVLERRAQEHINRGIEDRLKTSLADRVEQLTSYTQFKTLPLGPVGFAVSKAFGLASSNRVGRWWFLFGRFLGHTVDMTLAYNPLTFWTSLSGDSGNNRNQREKAIKEVFGTVNAYNDMVKSRAVAGGAFLLGMGSLIAMALAMSKDDDEPVFAVTGSAPAEDRQTKQLLQATGQWGEMQLRIGGKPVLNYSQIPEVAPLLLMLGNLSDSIRFNKVLYQRPAKDGEEPGKYSQGAGAIGAAAAMDLLASPLKRSTYRAWFDFIDSAMKGDGKATDQLANIATRPLDGALRFPLVVDADKVRDSLEGGTMPTGLVDTLMRRIPFVQAGQAVFNQYGEQVPAWDVISSLPSDPGFSEDVMRAAKLNVETGTRRTEPGDPRLKYENGTVREIDDKARAEYHQLSGQFYTESLLRHEASIRRAYEQGGQGAAAKIVGNVSQKANATARSRLGLE